MASIIDAHKSIIRKKYNLKPKLDLTKTTKKGQPRKMRQKIRNEEGPNMITQIHNITTQKLENNRIEKQILQQTTW